MIIYFSGTGNSRYAASLLAHRLGDELVDASIPIKAGEKAEYTSDRPWVFVSPTYAWQMARPLEAYIRNGMFRGSRKVYFVMTCGNDIGNPERVLEELCRMKGLSFQGVLEVVMPENYVAMFSVPTPEEAAPIIQAAHPVLEKGAELIAKEEPFPQRTTGFGDRVKSGINYWFYEFFVKSKHFYSTADCNGCGLCEKVCPLNNIVMNEGEKYPLWGEDCTHCMACICRCPTKAIEYGRKTKNKPRYLCPEYQEQ